MKSIPSTYSILSKHLLGTGICLSILIIIQKNLTYIFLTGIPIILGICFWVYTKILAIKLNRLKKYGRCFLTNNISLTPTYFLKIKGFYSFYINVEFTDDNHKTYTVKSHLLSVAKRKQIILSKNNTVVFKHIPSVYVYTDCNNLDDYIIDVKI